MKNNKLATPLSKKVARSFTEMFGRSYTIGCNVVNGCVSGIGKYCKGDLCVLECIPQEHYHFVQWSDGCTLNPREFTVKEDVSLIAYCVGDSFILKAPGAVCEHQLPRSFSYGSVVTLSLPDGQYAWADGYPYRIRTVVVEGDATYDVIQFEALEVKSHGLSTVSAEGLEYSANGVDWYPLDGPVDFDTIYLRGNTKHIHFEGDVVDLSGYLSAVAKEYNTLFADEPICSAADLILPSFGRFTGMFCNCTRLVEAPVLPTKLLSYCFASMFEGCISLVKAPVLPAKVLQTRCYAHMFEGCTSLKSTPILPATTLATRCYANMFAGCTSLVHACNLLAVNLADGCYANMFEGCTSLYYVPTLPALYVPDAAYECMFKNTSINAIYMYAEDGGDGSFNGMVTCEYGTLVTSNPDLLRYFPDGWVIG